MAAEVLTTEPIELVVGTAVAWERAFDGWLPAEGTVSYAFQLRNGGAGGFTKNATTSGDLFRLALDPADTTGKTAGAWTWTAKIAAGGVDYFLDAGAITFRANPFEGAVDERTSWETIRDNIRTAIVNEDNSLVASYSFDNLSLAKASKAELFDALAFAEEMVEQEANALAADRGESPSTRSTIRMEFP